MRERSIRIILLIMFLLIIFLTSQAQSNNLTVPTITRNGAWMPVERSFNGVPMVLVPPGCLPSVRTFSSGPRCFDQPFWIDKYEITQSLWVQYLPRRDWTASWWTGQRPVDYVTLPEARQLCTARGGRLPLESEWKYAASGPDNLIYPWGNQLRLPDEHPRYHRAAYNGHWPVPEDVGSYPGGASWVGAMDMAGNVWEWVGLTPYGTQYPGILIGGYYASAGENITTNSTTGVPSFVQSTDYVPATRGWGFRCMRPVTAENIAAGMLPSPTPIATLNSRETVSVIYGSDAQYLYNVDVPQGNTIQIIVTSAEFDPHIELYNGSTRVASADESSSDRGISEIVYSSSTSGNYQVKVLSADGSQSGSFSLVTLDWQQEVQIGDTIQGSAEFAEYAIYLQAGEGVNLQATSDDTTFLAEVFGHYVRVFQGPVQIENTECAGYDCSSSLAFTADKDGFYIIQYQPFNSNYDDGELFSIVITRGKPTILTPIQVDETISATLDQEVANMAFLLDLEEGQTVIIDLQGEFDTYLEIYNGRTLVASDEDSGEDSNSLLTFTAPALGTYALHVISRTQDNTTGIYSAGNFTLTVTGEVPPEEAELPEGVILTVRSSLASQEIHTLELSEGQTVTIDVQGDFDIVVEVSIFGDLIAEDDDGGQGSNSLLTFTAPRTEIYEIRVRDCCDSRAFGDYTLTVTAEGGGISAAAPTGVIGVGETVSKTSQSREMFSLDLNAGQTVTIDLQATWDTYLELYSGGALIASDDDGGEGSNSQLRFTAPSTGTYMIRVKAYGIEEAFGAFTLSVSE
jgi:hypothetical protein